MFLITDKEIKHDELSLKLNDDRAGALVFFDGRVRNHNEGLQVKSLEYQCYQEMALSIGKEVMEKAMSQFSIHGALCVHREGHLKIGEMAVWVGVSSSHRKEAFLACQYIIDEIKSLVPIWKKEHYVDLPAKWVACHQCIEASQVGQSSEHLSGENCERA